MPLIANADIVLNFVPVSLRNAGQHINPLTVVLQLLCLSTLRLRSLSKASRPPRRRWIRTWYPEHFELLTVMGNPGRGGAEKTGNSCPRWAYFVCRSEECNDFKGLSPNAPIWPVSAATYSSPRSGWQTEKCTCFLRSETFSASRVCLGPDHASFPMRACFQATATLAHGALL